jgi:type 1 fimbria pilin
VSPWMTIAANGSQLAVSNFAAIATLATASCSVATPSVAVTLPTVFPGNLATGSAWNTLFNLSVSCPSGINVNVTLADASDPSNRSTTLGLASGSSATGVGLRILRGSIPVAFGPDSAVAGNTNQWLAGTATGGVMNIPLTVQYVRTSGEWTPGTVKGLATFTMSYQ